MTLADADAEHLRLYRAFRALANAVDAAMPDIRGQGRARIQAAMVKAAGAIDATRPILSLAAPAEGDAT